MMKGVMMKPTKRLAATTVQDQRTLITNCSPRGRAGLVTSGDGGIKLLRTLYQPFQALVKTQADGEIG